MNILCLFIPSFFSVFLYKKLYETKTVIDLIISYGIFVFFSNLITFFILMVISGTQYNLYLETSPLSFIIKVLLLNLATNLCVFVLLVIIEKKIELSLAFKQEENNEKNNKN